MSRTMTRLAAIAVFLVAQAGLTSAAEVKVFSTIGVQAALEELAPKFERASGHKLNITWATAAILVKRVQAGETADLMVLTKQSLDALTKDGKASEGADAAFASSGMAVVVKKGAAKPDISTPDAYKKALLEAKTIAYSDPAAGGTSGVFFAKTLERMGIAEQMKAKTKHPPPSGNSAVLVANGEADLAIQQAPEVMSVAGIDVIGSPPGDLNNITVYAAGIGAGSQQAEAANALIKFLHTPEAVAVFREKGLKPADAPKGT
ncbi:MAG TPA: molybdate ABC transporter substrate-binding protein [Pseudolabrys sp.]|nr:molybdate ABC transporter substrate-binding protein [Pseudolabrys sp.]